MLLSFLFVAAVIFCGCSFVLTSLLLAKMVSFYYLYIIYIYVILYYYVYSDIGFICHNMYICFVSYYYIFIFIYMYIYVCVCVFIIVFDCIQYIYIWMYVLNTNLPFFIHLRLSESFFFMYLFSCFENITQCS